MVSGTQKVAKNPISMNPENINNKFPTPMLFFKRENPCAERIAPAFPEAAAIPWQVDLNLVGNTSPGIMNVVVLGPKLKKNCPII